MSFLHEPSRGGTRGGKDQFAWKDVEVDKHRENYLGKKSLNAKLDFITIMYVCLLMLLNTINATYVMFFQS